jgi:hypothetical protein
VRGNIEHRLPSERILLAQAIRIPQRHRRGNFGAQLMPVMDRRRHDGPSAALHRPPSIRRLL